MDDEQLIPEIIARAGLGFANQYEIGRLLEHIAAIEAELAAARAERDGYAIALASALNEAEDYREQFAESARVALSVDGELHQAMAALDAARERIAALEGVTTIAIEDCERAIGGFGPLNATAYISGRLKALRAALSSGKEQPRGNHRFVDGQEFGICARCGEFSADPIHSPIFPEERGPVDLADAFAHQLPKERGDV